MASVLLCEDERLGRQVAVKRLHADSPVDVEHRFNREAKLGASLNHPNFVSVFDTTTDDEGVLIVMEYVDGETLSRMLRRGPLRPEEVVRMVLDLGDVLDHAHAQGVVHRDVKPGNVLIRPDGMTKLADLGIATAADGTRITRSGTVLGTAAYMAPEQLDGRVAGPPADIYALAAIAFEALSGQKPRQGRTPMEIAHKIATEGPPDLREAWPNAPRAAAHVLQRGMAQEPEDRPPSAGEFARELATALEAPPQEKTARTRLLGRRRSRAGAAVGAGAVGGAAPAAAAAPEREPVRWAEPEPTPPDTPSPPITAPAKPSPPRKAGTKRSGRRRRRESSSRSPSRSSRARFCRALTTRARRPPAPSGRLPSPRSPTRRPSPPLRRSSRRNRSRSSSPRRRRPRPQLPHRQRTTSRPTRAPTTQRAARRSTTRASAS